MSSIINFWYFLAFPQHLQIMANISQPIDSIHSNHFVLYPIFLTKKKLHLFWMIYFLQILLVFVAEKVFLENLKFKSFIFSSYKIEILKSNFCHFSCKSDLNWILLNLVGIYMPAVLDLLKKSFKFCSKLASFFHNLNLNMNNASSPVQIF